jgi:uridylate kinase
MNCDAMMKGTNVDGVYSADPKKDKDAERYDNLSYMEVLSKDLRVMDASAVALSRENEIPIVVFSIQTSGGFVQVLHGEGACTIVRQLIADRGRYEH